MKLKSLLLGIALLIASSMHGQVGEIRNEFAIGVNGGYALNRVTFNQPTIKQSFHGGTSFGLTMRYTCEKYFALCCALQAEVNYTEMGWKELIETSTDTYERDINYIQVPLLARLAMGREHKGFMGYLILGPQVGFYLNDVEKKGTSDGSEGWTNLTLWNRPNHVTQQYGLPVKNTFEYGITGGLGMELNTEIGHFLLEGRYYYGLSDIFGSSKKDVFGKSSNGAIIAKASYLFDIRKKKPRE